jgi:CelD/BcsL family acetyltransferase involved in cellulose biosynthesis
VTAPAPPPGSAARGHPPLAGRDRPSCPAGLNSRWDIEAIDNAAGLERLEAEWWELWRQTPEATPFQSPAWLIPWWRAFAPGRLFTLAARRDGRLVGLAPFYIEDGALGRRILPIGISLSDYGDVLLAPEGRAETADALVRHLEERSDLWDGIDLEELRPEAAALALALPAGCRETRSPQSACPTLVLPPDRPALFDCVPKRKRKQIHLARNRAARRGAVAVETADPASAPAFLEELIWLHGARWASRGEEGVLADETVRAFQRAAVPRLAAAGLLRLLRMTIGGEAAGVYLGFSDRGRAYGYLTGLEPAFGYESPGVSLLAHAIEQAIEEGVTEFHMLRGQEPYKYEWGAVDRWNVRRSIRRCDG